MSYVVDLPPILWDIMRNTSNNSGHKTENEKCGMQDGIPIAAVTVKKVRTTMKQYEVFGDAKWVCAGAITKKGHPHHPLYLRKDEKIRPFDVAAYLESLK